MIFVLFYSVSVYPFENFLFGFIANLYLLETITFQLAYETEVPSEVKTGLRELVGLYVFECFVVIFDFFDLLKIVHLVD